MRRDDFLKLSEEEKRALLAQFHARISSQPAERPLHLLALAAPDEQRLRERVRALCQELQQRPGQELGARCYAANTAEPSSVCRLATTAATGEQLEERLQAFLNNSRHNELWQGQATRRPRLAFLFSGQGMQYPGMGRLLYETQPAFRRTLERCSELVAPHLERPLLDVIFPRDGEASLLNETEYTQTALFALEYSLYDLWRSWGVTPDIVVGHSLGEYVASCAAGLFSLEDGLTLVARRARLMQAQPRVGMMAAVRADENTVRAALAGEDDRMVIALINNDDQTVISGLQTAVQAVITRLQATGIDARPLRVSHAFHSPLMHPVREPLADLMRQVRLHPPQLPIVSNLTGRILTTEEALNPDYWVRHMCEPVRFLDDLKTLKQQGVEAFVEIGPAAALLNMGKRCLGMEAGLWLPSLLQGRSDWQVLLESAATLFVHGVDLDWQGFERDYQPRPLTDSAAPAGPSTQRLPELTLTPAALHQPFPLTDIQAAYFVGKQLPLHGDQIGCHTYLEFAVNNLHMERLKASWRQLVAHHPMLRAVVMKNGQQRIQEDVPPFDIAEYDLRGQRTAKLAHLQTLRARLSHRVYQPGSWPLWELCVTHVDEALSLVHVSMDSWIVDGASAELLYMQWYRLYHEPDYRLPALEVSFRDYVLALKRFEGSEAYEEHMQYWLRKLCTPLLQEAPLLPAPKAPPPGASYHPRRRVQERIEPQVWEVLKQYARSLSISPTTLLLTTFTETLAAWSERNSFSLVLTQQNRLPLHPQIAQVVGPFTTTSIFVVDHRETLSFAERAQRAQKQIWEDLNHSSVSASSALKRLSTESGMPVSLPIVFTSRTATSQKAAEHSWLEQVRWMITQTPGVALDYQATERENALYISWDIVDACFSDGQGDVLFSSYVQALRWLVNEHSAAQREENTMPAEQAAHTAEKREFPLTALQQSYALARLQARGNPDAISLVYQEFEVEWPGVARFKEACQRLLQRHEMLQVVISPRGTQRIQDTVEDLPFTITYLDTLTEQEQQTQLEQIKDRMLRHEYRLDGWPHFEIRLTRLTESRAIVHICVDMLIADGYSIVLLWHDFLQYCTGHTEEAALPHFSFRHYQLERQARRRGIEEQEALAYWRKKIRSLPPGPSFTGEKDTQTRGRSRLEGRLPIWSQVTAQAEKLGVSPDCIPLAAFQAVLRAWSECVPFTTTVALLDRARIHPSATETVGDFTALCWLTAQAEQRTFHEEVRHTHATLEQDLAQSVVSGIEGLRQISREEAGWQPPQWRIVFTSCRGTEKLTLPASCRWGTGISQTPGIDLDCFVFVEGDRLSYHWDYQEGAISTSLLQEMFQSYTQLLQALIEQPDLWQERDLSNLLRQGRLTQDQHPDKADRRMLQQVLHEWNATETSYDREQCLHHLFEIQAARSPWRIATVTTQGTMTYGEVNARANRVAHYLQRCGVGPGTLVGVCVDRSHEMIIAVMAILKAGGAYVPLEPSDPAQRRALILEISRVRIVVTQEKYASLFDTLDMRAIPLDRQDLFARENALEPPHTKVTSSDPAYAIFTSGSTGRPKGVLVTHQPVVNLIEWVEKMFQIGPQDRALFVSPFTFDLSVYDIFGLLGSGGSLRIVSDEERQNALFLAKVLGEEDITFWNSAPAVLQTMVPFLSMQSYRPRNQRLRLVFLSGDWIPLSLPDAIRSVFTQARVISLGGATEATVWSNYYPVGVVDPTWRSIPYGWPIQNAKYYILDEDMDMCAANVAGELHIGGDCLASGYLNDPTLTSERFIRDPFDPTGRGKLYRTGDLARYWPDGTIEILGRVDYQVKIRGYRIELGEVEHGLRSAGLREAIAVAREDSMGGKILIAFGIPRTREQTVEEIEARLPQLLPAYMLPSQIVLLGALPMTSNGKIDRKALMTQPLKEIAAHHPLDQLSPTEGMDAGVVSTVAETRDEQVGKQPSSSPSLTAAQVRASIESTLRKIIAELLMVTPEELDESQPFGRMGLTSLHFAVLSADLLQHYGIEVEPTLFYKHATLPDLVTYLHTEHGQAFLQSIMPTEGERSAGENEQVREAGTEVVEASNVEGTSTDDNNADAIAIVGMWGQMPAAANLEEFWRNLIEGRDCIEEIPGERWDWRAYYGDPERERGKTLANRGGFLPELDAFDAEFFAISPREAELMDPRQRLLLEAVWKAVEDAGYRASSLNGANVGIFVGGTGDDFARMSLINAEAPDAYTLTGISPSLLANRISYHMNWHGPSEVIDTACSSSLVAVHRAVMALRRHECEVAVAAGVNTMLDPITQINLSRVGMLSPDGKCKTFDRSANGYVRGEGVGVVFLKPLAHAQADKDHIYGVIRGSAVNHGGRANSLTAPNPVAQTQLLLDAYHDAGIDPATVGYIETHGTGTALGDPIEVGSLTEAFAFLYKEWGHEDAETHCGLGAVKTNIGHLESASGMAGLLKLLLALQHKQLPPSIHLRELNPHLHLEQTPFYIVREAQEWSTIQTMTGETVPRRAGVSAFGFGGTNAHVVVEEYVPLQSQYPQNHDEQEHIVVLSARNEERLRALAGEMVNYLQAHPEASLQSIAYTLQVGREALPERLACVVRTPGELLRVFTSLTQQQPLPTSAYRGNTRHDRARLVELTGGREPDVVSAEALAARRLPLLAQLWVAGAAIQWEPLYAVQPARISLPTYPFARTRYWPEYLKQATTAQPVAAPVNPLRGEEITPDTFVIQLRGDEFFLVDHVVQQRMVLPGAAYIELVWALGERIGVDAPCAISGLTWLSPVISDGSAQKLLVTVQSRGERMELRVLSEAPTGQSPTVHCTGQLLTAASGEREAFPLSIFQQRNHSILSAKACYEHFQRLDIHYGPSFQVLEEVAWNQQEALARLMLPAHAAQADFTLHPALLDGALQTALLLDVLTSNDEALYVPYAVDEITIYSTLPAVCYVYVTHQAGSRPDQRRKDIRFLDEQGRVLVRLRGVYARPLAQETVRPRKQVHSYRSIWTTRTLLKPVPAGVPLAQSLLIIDSPELARHLRPYVAQVISVDGQTIWHTRQQDAPETLLPTFSGREALPDSIVLDLSGRIVAGTHEAQLHAAFAGIFSLCKLLVSSRARKRINIILCYQEQAGQPFEQLLYRSLASFCKTVRLEQPLLHFTILEFQHEQRASLLPEAIMSLLRMDEPPEELRLTAHADAQIPHIEPISLPDVSPGQAFRRGGVYLISGGMGRIGWHIAQHLTQTYQARLVLIGRSPLNEEMRMQLAQLREQGGEVLYVRADVAQREDVRMVVSRARAAYGTLHGIVHCAGVLQDGLLLRKSWQQVQRVLAPKLLGALYLDEETAADPLDCFLLCSSLVALNGNVGQSDYAYANRALDEYALLREAKRQRGERSGRSLSILWGLWRDGGMHVSSETEAQLSATVGMVPLATAQAIGALERALATPETRLALVAGDGSKLNAWLSGGESMQTLAQEPSHNVQSSPAPSESTRREKATDSDALRAYVEHLIRTIVASETKSTYDSIDVTEPLETYGIDSLLIVAITRRLEETFGELSKTLLFEYQTIAELTGYFVEHHQTTLSQLTAEQQPVRAHEEPELSNVAQQQVDVGTMSEDAHVNTGTTIEQVEIAGVRPIDTMEKSGEDTMADQPLSTLQAEEDIAIIGMAGQFPMASSVEEFWRVLTEGQDCITEIPAERWDYRAYPDVMKWGGFMRDVDRFDPLFFHISNREAEWLDPQERLFLQTVYHTLEDAGYTRKRLAESHVGVYVGLMWAQYQLYGVEKANAASSYGSIANRVSYFFNFGGPSIALDTMCSSSLTALHLACESLKRGETDMAIAGGVNLNVHPNKHMFLSTRGFAASDGRCHSFGEGGDGYVPGEGVGAVLLKPLSRARKDGDRIYAVVKATSINHGGKTNGYTVPNPRAQASLIADAVRKAKIDPRTISYIEAHGTGTALGDPIEITGLSNAFKPYTSDTQFCAIGSVKSNIGHLEGAAGIAGIIKVILQMQHQQLVPSIHSETLNKHIDFSKTPFYVQRTMTPWSRPVLADDGGPHEHPRRAGISSFGAGGANAHIILEEYPQRVTALPEYEAHLVTLSAKDTERLKEYAGSLLAYLTHRPQLAGARVVDATPAVQAKGTATRLLECLAQVLGVPQQFLDLEDLFEDYALTASQIQQLLRELNEAFGVHVSEAELAQQQSPHALAEHIQHVAREQGQQLPGQEVDLSEQLTLANIAYTMQTGREAMETRLAIVATTIDDLKGKLERYLTGDSDDESILVGTPGLSDTFTGKEESKAFLEQLLRNRRLAKLARLWCKGASIDWSALYDPGCYLRIPLPLYPFARERCWVSDPTLVGPQLASAQAERVEAPTPQPAPTRHTSEAVQVTPVVPQPQEPKIQRNHMTPTWREEVLARFFYLPQWVEVANVRSVQSLQDYASAPAGTSLIISGGDGQAVRDALLQSLPESRTYEIRLGKETRLLTPRSWEINVNDPDALGFCLSYLKHLKTVYFLGGIQSTSSSLDDSTRFQRIQQEGIMTLLRLVKSLDEQGLANAGLRLVVVTSNVYAVTSGEETRPFAASVPGLTRAISKEYPYIRTALVDLDLAHTGVTEGLVRVLIEEQEQPEIAVRGGRAYKRILVPTTLSAVERTPWKQHGCYVIIGGSGNVGMKVSRYLAETAQAHVVWFGRRALNMELREKIYQIEQSGGEVHYMQVDVANADELARALREVETRYGAINAIFHSALDFQMTRLRDLDEAGCEQALRAKVAGTLALWQALQKISIEHLVLFSSGEAFTGNAGWAAYGAACSAQDALGLFLAEHERYHTHVINWGFWDGNARGDNTLLTLKGIYPIRYEDGMEALQRILAHNVSQVMALHVEDRVLALMGVELPSLERASLTDDTREKQNGHQTGWSGRSLAAPVVNPDSTVTQPASQPATTAAVAVAEPPVPAADISERLAAYLTDLLAETLRIDRAKLDPAADLAIYGVDSLLVIGIHKELEDKLGTLPATLLIEQPSIQALTRYLLDKHPEVVARVLGKREDVAPVTESAQDAGEKPFAQAEEAPPVAIAAAQQPKREPVPSPIILPSARRSDIQVVRVVERTEMPQFLETYGQAYRDGSLKQRMSDYDVRICLERSELPMLQLLVQTASGRAIEVITAGRGTPILFMPAVALTAPVWYHQFKALSDNYQVIVMHAPGYGLSETIEDTSTRAVGEVFKDVLERLQIPMPLHIVSSCFGGIAAQYIAKTWRDRVGSLTMCGGFYENIGLPDIDPEKLSVTELFELTAAASASLKQDFDHLVERLGGGDQEAAARYQWCANLLLNSQCASPMIGMRYLNELLTLSTFDWLPQIIAPTLCITGTVDTVVQPDVSRIMSNRIPFARLLEIPEAGHYPFLTHPEVFNAQLVEHIEEQERRLTGGW